MLAFEPPDLGPARKGAGQGTLVGAVMGNLAGPRRCRGRGARQLLASARRQRPRRGLQVRRQGDENVTGYDISKRLTASGALWGRRDEVSVRSCRRPPNPDADDARTFPRRAVRRCAAALGSHHDVPAPPMHGRKALRIEGVAPSVEALLKGLRVCSQARRGWKACTLESRRSGGRTGPDAVVDVRDDVVGKISCPPTRFRYRGAHRARPSATAF